MNEKDFEDGIEWIIDNMAGVEVCDGHLEYCTSVLIAEVCFE